MQVAFPCHDKLSEHVDLKEVKVYFGSVSVSPAHRHSAPLLLGFGEGEDAGGNHEVELDLMVRSEERQGGKEGGKVLWDGLCVKLL